MLAMYFTSLLHLVMVKEAISSMIVSTGYDEHQVNTTMTLPPSHIRLQRIEFEFTFHWKDFRG